MNEQLEREEYWHWLHGLTGITQKEKEELLKCCPKAKIWYEAACKKQTKELFVQNCELTEAQMTRQRTVIDALESEEQRERLKKSYEALKKTEIRMVCRESEQYPSRLKNIFFAAACDVFSWETS